MSLIEAKKYQIFLQTTTHSGPQKDLIFFLPQTGVKTLRKYHFFLHTTTHTVYCGAPPIAFPLGPPCAGGPSQAPQRAAQPPERAVSTYAAPWARIRRRGRVSLAKCRILEPKTLPIGYASYPVHHFQGVRAGFRRIRTRIPSGRRGKDQEKAPPRRWRRACAPRRRAKSAFGRSGRSPANSLRSFWGAIEKRMTRLMQRARISKVDHL